MLGNEAYERSAELADPKDLFSLIDTLIENDTLNGKFIHIKDDKKKLSQALSENMFTLRRIDDFKFEEIR